MKKARGILRLGSISLGVAKTVKGFLENKYSFINKRGLFFVFALRCCFYSADCGGKMSDGGNRDARELLSTNSLDQAFFYPSGRLLTVRIN